MNKTYLIFKHEFMHKIKRVGFIIMTLIVPVLALLGIGVFKLASTISKPSVKEVSVIGYVDEVGVFNDQTVQGSIKLIPFVSKEAVTQALISREVGEYIIIPSDYLSTGTVKRYTLEKELMTPPATSAMIKRFLSINLLKDKVPPDLIPLIISPLNLEITRLNEEGSIAQEQSNIGNIIVPGVFAFLLGFTLMFSSSSLVKGMGEEKESRLIEVLFSSVSIRQLLIGKVLALGAAGLLQVLVWLLSAPLLLKLASTSFGGILSEIQIPGNFIFLGIIYFVLGYLLFAVLSLGIGAISPNAREGEQLSLIYTLLGFAPIWVLTLLFSFPHSPLWVVLTIFPVTAPVQTMLRLGVTGIPMWQILVSIGVLVLSIILGLFLVIKIFRMYMLMYGKRPGFKEIIHNLKKA
jgi:ABC-2 type transport system permease protein